MVIAQPDFTHLLCFLFNPIIEKNDVTNSTGQIIHQILPTNMAETIIRGHQYDQINKLARLKFRSSFKNLGSSEKADNPIIINAINMVKVKILKPVEMYFFLRKILIIVTI